MNQIDLLKFKTLNIKDDDIVIGYFNQDTTTYEEVKAIYDYLLQELDNKVFVIPDKVYLESYSGKDKEDLKKWLCDLIEKL